MCLEHNSKAVIAKDGLSITFLHKGKEWTASPSELRPGWWFVRATGKGQGFGIDIWGALVSALSKEKR